MPRSKRPQTPATPSPPPPKKDGGGISDRTATVIISVVTAVWAANIVAGMVQINGYQPLESVNGIFLVIVGGIFVARGKGRNE